jgi:MarR family transcriptional regulator, lower aerobic nicotinate degradation pathway regulator
MPDVTVTAGQQLLPLIEYLARVGRRSADASMTGCLRPRQLIALNLLAEHGPMTQTAMGAALSLDPSNVVGLLNELEEGGFVARRRDPADRRRHIVELSATGSGELAHTYDRLDSVEDQLFRGLTAAERETLHDLLARAVAALTPSPCAAKNPCAAAEPDPCVEPAGNPCTEDLP